ncbi:DUF481 domain-containing protein [Mariprofundus sp. KV]|uniref:DUF481 domain-containing protein n=1 Tax=Mariprofundus sp. KV TaxID=2608715 RepID=UPI0015A102C3|nr:DUF481 domain-containing protein [Mariprofundus sp. KV]NWF37419.1 DUF481 domain-containing protein [Mariprofundus sp. KV]
MQIIIILFLLFTPAQAWAIINAEDLDLSVDAEGFGGKFGFSVSGSSGNSEKVAGEASGRLLWRHGPHTNMFVASHAYGKSRGVRDTNKSFAHLRHRYALDRTWDAELFGQAQQNEFALLKLRTLLGGGLRWSQQQGGLSLAIGLGSFIEREELKAAANEPVTSLWRGNSYISLYYALNERVRLQNTLYYQPAWRDPADFRLLDDVAVSLSLTDTLDLKLAVEIANDSRPPATIKDTDISYKTGLELRF